MSNIEEFHARIKFVDADGYLTREAMAALRASRKPVLPLVPTAQDNTNGFWQFIATTQGHIYCDKGTVTAILYTRGDMVVDLNIGVELIPMNPYDKLTIIYSAVPELHWFPW